MPPAGLSFLNLKPWHPSNKWNQKKIWIAEQQFEDEKKAIDEKRKELQKEEDLLKYKKMATARGDLGAARQESMHSVGFMYSAPPGLQRDTGNEEEDDAVREFNDRVRKETLKKLKKDENFSARVQHSDLEKSVGRKRWEQLSIDEQIERFPFLKDAPVEGKYAQGVAVTFKPFNKVVQNIRCLRCGEWGHRGGDRDCKMKDFNPNDEERLKREDPLNNMSQSLAVEKQKLTLNRAALPSEMGGATGEHQLVSDHESESSDPEKDFLASLSKSDRRLLLKGLTRESKKGKKEKKVKKDKKKKEKKEKKSKRDRSRSRSPEDSTRGGKRARKEADVPDDDDEEPKRPPSSEELAEQQQQQQQEKRSDRVDGQQRGEAGQGRGHGEDSREERRDGRHGYSRHREEEGSRREKRREQRDYGDYDRYDRRDRHGSSSSSGSSGRHHRNSDRSSGHDRDRGRHHEDRRRRENGSSRVDE